MTAEEAKDDDSTPPEEEDRGDLEEGPISPWHVWNTNAHDVADTGKLAEELAERLQNASTILLDRLFEYLSRLPSEEKDDSSNRSFGLTLPASAIGWLSTQLYPKQVVSTLDDDRPNDEALWMGASMRDRLALLKFLLPRVVRLRVTSEEWPPSRPEKVSSSQQQQPYNFEGRDVNPDEMSVQSTLTVESAVPPRPSLRAFLIQYYVLQNRPRVDLQLFPNLNVLLLDRMPPTWISNLHLVRDSLELLRTERTCIYNLTDCLFPSRHDEEPLVVNGDDHAWGLNKLTHLKLKNCGIGELSGLTGKVAETENESHHNGDDHNDALAPIPVQQYSVPPPLSRLPNLVSLSLARNDLINVRTALSGLSSLPLLRRLDLSHNHLVHLRGANTMLGNIKVLILTGNRIQSVRGLDRLYSLERLSLDRNKLKDLASIAGLAKLPELKSLKLLGNPVAESQPTKYRVEVLNLFREQRFVRQPQNTTFRQLLEVLPVLDGKPASKHELVALRGFAFYQMVGLAESQTTIAESSILSSSIEDEPRVDQSLAISSLSVAKRMNRVSRRGRPRKIVIEEGLVDHVELPSPMNEGNSDPVFLKEDDDIAKNASFSLADVVASLPKLSPEILESEEAEEDFYEPDRTLDNTEGGETKESIGDSLQNGTTHLPFEDSPMNEGHVGTLVEASLQQANARDRTNGLSFISLSPVLKYGSIQVNTPMETNASTHVDFESQTNPQPPGQLVANGSEKRINSSELENSPPPDANNRNEDKNEEPISKIPIQSQAPSNSVMLAEEPDALTSDEELPERADQFDSILSPTPETIVFPDYVWEEDENSVLSSIKMNTVGAASLENKYRKVEEESAYDGLEHLKGLPVLTNLELYFRCFVFRIPLPDKQQEDQSEEEKLQLMLDLAPRIQLRPVDWKSREALARSLSTMEIYATTERFDRLWTEEALACGKLAAKRLTPHRKPNRGFHGDVLFSNGKLQKSAECRSLIVCASDSAIYIISDYDAVTRHQLAKAGKRRFPLPIPQDALFQNGSWPHALARHPIITLDRITIGFGFQRLALHFRPGRESAGRTSDEFTYIFMTCNKLRTVNLLQHFQSLAKEHASRSSNDDVELALKIDNDDKQVLDALTEVAAPEAVGMIMHYQIVQQRWQHGDRGTVRRACIVTDTNLYLLDEDYVGDGSESFEAGARGLGEVCFRMVDSAGIEQVTEVQAGLDNPNSVTIVIKPLSRLQRYHRWRLLCRDREGAERLVEDIRKALPEESIESLG